jgi:predicted nuclease of restriction endonuclease-like (RecB) superfamily
MKKPRNLNPLVTSDYLAFIEDLKKRVLSARIFAARAITHEAILLYWDIGKGIVEKQKANGWGDSVVEMISRDLQRAFPGTKGFSPQNLWRMQQLYVLHTQPDFLSQVVREMEKDGKGAPCGEKLSHIVREMVSLVPWGHHANALLRVSDPNARLWYLRATAKYGWSRNVLLNQIKAGAYERAVTEKKTHNFGLALPEHFAEQADEMLKSSYNLDFLGLGKAVIERGPEDQPSIGIILCAEKDYVEVEFALRTKDNPIGVAAYELQSKLPVNLKGKLPTAKQLADIVRVEMGGGK